MEVAERRLKPGKADPAAAVRRLLQHLPGQLSPTTGPSILQAFDKWELTLDNKLFLSHRHSTGTILGE